MNKTRREQFHPIIIRTNSLLRERWQPSLSSNAKICTDKQGIQGHKIQRRTLKSHREGLKKLRKKTEKLNEDDYEILYTSQIGLVFLKPCVRFSTTVYFHTKSDQGSPAQDSRCDLDFFSSYWISTHHCNSSFISFRFGRNAFFTHFKIFLF